MTVKILTYNGKDPIIVPPDHTIIFCEGSRVRTFNEACAAADRVAAAVTAAEEKMVDRTGREVCAEDWCKESPVAGRYCHRHAPGTISPEAVETVLLNKEMLRDSFNLAARDVINSGAVPSAFYAALEKQIFGGAK